jgi:hypothetical protein
MMVVCGVRLTNRQIFAFLRFNDSHYLSLDLDNFARKHKIGQVN